MPCSPATTCASAGRTTRCGSFWKRWTRPCPAAPRSGRARPRLEASPARSWARPGRRPLARHPNLRRRSAARRRPAPDGPGCEGRSTRWSRRASPTWIRGPPAPPCSSPGPTARGNRGPTACPSTRPSREWPRRAPRPLTAPARALPATTTAPCPPWRPPCPSEAKPPRPRTRAPPPRLHGPSPRRHAPRRLRGDWWRRRRRLGLGRTRGRLPAATQRWKPRAPWPWPRTAASAPRPLRPSCACASAWRTSSPLWTPPSRPAHS
mmetsp:Transcript_56471/g.150171  ORF Transcript_56471/g.150171 Transcript_56471/m.150171 type:complete len:264 (-) Transcript_56471:222-1013(-)